MGNTPIHVDALSINDLVLIVKKDITYTSWNENRYGIVAAVTGDIVTIINNRGTTETIDLNKHSQSEYYQIYALSEYAYIEEVESEITRLNNRAKEARDDVTKLEIYLERFKNEISLFGKLKKLFQK